MMPIIQDLYTPFCSIPSIRGPFVRGYETGSSRTLITQVYIFSMVTECQDKGSSVMKGENTKDMKNIGKSFRTR